MEILAILAPQIRKIGRTSWKKALSTCLGSSSLFNLGIEASKVIESKSNMTLFRSRCIKSLNTHENPKAHVACKLHC